MEQKTTIAYSIKAIESFKKSLEENNKNIIEKLGVLKNEYKNMSSILSTPNSNKIIPEIYDVVNKYDKYVKEKEMYFDKVLNVILTEYKEFNDELKNSVEKV